MEYFRELTDLRDSMRCPLEIVSDKKKRSWTAMKIVKKPEETEHKTSLILASPKIGQFKFLLALPKPLRS